MAAAARPSASTHERLGSDEAVHGSSDRSFGLVFAAIFALIGLWPLVHWRSPRWWSVVLGGAFLVAALGNLRILAPLHRLWLRLGLLLHAVVQPVIMTLLFYTTVTPIALVFRLLGKDPLRLRLEKDATTYWLDRRPPGPAPDTMSRQF